MVIPLILGLFFWFLHISVFFIGLAIILFIFSVYFAFFFRNPNREICAGPDDIVSPVDGTVLDVVNEGETRRLVVFLSIFNVHITRMPHEGHMDKMEYFHGVFLPAYREKASELNERIILTVKSKNFQYQLKLIAGIAARRIKMWVNQGEKIPTGKRIGIIMFGSRAELIVPKNVELFVKKSDRVYGGKTLIGKIKNPE